MSSDIIVALIGAAVTVGNVIFTAIVSRLSAKSGKEKAFEDGLQCLLRAEIIRSHDKYTAQGYCPIYAKESLRRVYTAYHNLGGNDIATALYNECLDMTDSL